jgi:AcrR family transcriptional regulator
LRRRTVDILVPTSYSRLRCTGGCTFGYPRHVSIADAAHLNVPRRKFQQGDTARRVLDAAIELLQEQPRVELTMRAVAARASVPMATAYNYFSSKNALIAQVYLEMLRTVRPCTDPTLSAVSRVTVVLHRVATLVAEDSEVAATCAIVMLANEPDLERTRSEIEYQFYRLVSSALGPKAPAGMASTLMLAYSGALLHLGTGARPRAQLTDRLENAVSLIVDGNL